MPCLTVAPGTVPGWARKTAGPSSQESRPQLPWTQWQCILTIFKLVVVGGQVLYQLFLLSWKQKFQDILNFSTFQCMNYFPFCLVLFVFCLRNLCLLPYCKMFWIFFKKHYCFIVPFYFYNPSGIACSLWCKKRLRYIFLNRSIHWNDRLFPVALACRISHKSGVFICVELFLGSILFLSLSLGSSGLVSSSTGPHDLLFLPRSRSPAAFWVFTVWLSFTHYGPAHLPVKNRRRMTKPCFSWFQETFNLLFLSSYPFN